MKKSGYGLQIRVAPSQQKKKQPTRPPLPTVLGFGDGDDNNVEEEINRQATSKKAQRDIEEQHKKALEEDPLVFDYDGAYDEMKLEAVQPRAKEREEKKPKYIQMLIEKAKKRDQEHDMIYERRLAKERSKEDDKYAEKDKFVTGAYKRKLQEDAKWLEEQRLEELREERDDVTKKTDISDFYFNLTKNVAFGGGEGKSKKTKKHHEQIEVAAQTQEKPSSPENAPLHISREIKRHEREASVSPRKDNTEQTDMKPSSSENGPASDNAQTIVNESAVSDQPKGDHHRRSQDAVAAAKERFLARKKAKEQ